MVDTSMMSVLMTSPIVNANAATVTISCQVNVMYII
jgi:hypothetical protein